MRVRSGSRSRWRVRAALALAAGLALPVVALPPAGAASSDACAGGGFVLRPAAGGAPFAQPEFQGTVSPPSTFLVDGTYIEFVVDAATFEVRDYTFTGAANEEDITGGARTPVWASKKPLHGGNLTSAMEVDLDEEDLVVQRTGRLASGVGLTMKIQAKDCAQGGIFQMEVERNDGAKTVFVHRLTPNTFFFDNRNFRDNAGKFLGSGCTSEATGPPGQFCVQVSPRTNIGNDTPDFVARDSAQGGPAPNDTVRLPHAECGSANQPGIDHCGGVSVWLVASGGRMGFVTGEDAVEVANPPTECVENCQAQNRVRGRLAVLGFPFPVAPGDRLVPRLCTLGANCPAEAARS